MIGLLSFPDRSRALSFCYCFGLLTLLLLTFGLAGCQSGDSDGEDASARTVVDITAMDYAYRNVPDSIPAGWTTFRMRNEGTETHNLELQRLPEGIVPQDWRAFMGTYRELWSKVRAGEITMAEFQEGFPNWMDSVEGAGGLEHLAPGRTASITTRLEPGTYAMFCYVKTPEERGHLELGMERAFTVTTDSTGAGPPKADLSLRAADYEITADGEMSAGEQTVAVHFGERSKTDADAYQTVVLARVPDSVSVDRVAAWPNEHQTPAPTDFLGGVLDMAPGKTAYLTVDVSPGRYAWVSHASKEKGMRKTFTVE